MQFGWIVEVGKLTLHIFGNFLEIYTCSCRGQEYKMYGMNGKYEVNEIYASLTFW